MKKRKTLKQFLVPRLRRLSKWWYGRTDAKNAAKVRVQEGFYKNGKPKFRNKFYCAECDKLHGGFHLGPLYKEEDVQMDHIYPILNLDGFIDWNTTIDRMFPEQEGWQCLCLDCHQIKTLAEGDERRERKKKG